MSGKGDTPRPVNFRRYAEGWNRIFGGRVLCPGCGHMVRPRARCGRGWTDEMPEPWVGTSWYACPRCCEQTDPPPGEE